MPLGFDLQPFYTKRFKERKAQREKWGIEKHDVAIGIVGRLAPVKNHTFFLEVIEEVLQKTTKSIKVFIVGDGAERRPIEEIVSKINMRYDNRITMTSWISDIGQFNAAIDIMCLTSTNEGTPISLIEA